MPRSTRVTKSRPAAQHGPRQVPENAAVRITQAVGVQDIAHARALFETYATSLAIDLSFQDFAHELATLPGAYRPPDGRLLVAWAGAHVIGVVALRPLAHDICEMKRLYVTAEARGTGLGRHLVERAITDARAIGYAALRLDTLPTMHAAIRLYRTLGFREIAPYRDNPIAGALYFEAALL